MPQRMQPPMQQPMQPPPMGPPPPLSTGMPEAVAAAAAAVSAAATFVPQAPPPPQPYYGYAPPPAGMAPQPVAPTIPSGPPKPTRSEHFVWSIAEEESMEEKRAALLRLNQAREGGLGLY